MMKISCPSKTFLSGEYAVIDGGPAILLATPPYFILRESNFIDPYHGAGGFGASGAKFVLASKKEGYSDPWAVWRKYRQSGLPGSGADVVTQWMGGITFFHADQKVIENISWPFENLYIALIHTGYKIQTHEHLQELNQCIPAFPGMTEGGRYNFKSLENIVLKMYEALRRADQENFLTSINHYHIALSKLKLVCENTQWILDKMKSYPDIMAAKGCGALGADVILAVIKKKNKNNFLIWANQKKLNIIYCDNQFARGISCE